MEAILTDFKFKQEQNRDNILNHILNIRSKLPAAILEMKIGHLQNLFEQSLKTYEQVRDHMNTTNGALANITNQTLNSISMASAKKVSRTDDGEYLRPFLYPIRFFYSIFRLKMVLVLQKLIQKKQTLAILSIFSFQSSITHSFMHIHHH